jgi:hypothetical protein
MSTDPYIVGLFRDPTGKDHWPKEVRTSQDPREPGVELETVCGRVFRHGQMIPPTQEHHVNMCAACKKGA